MTGSHHRVGEDKAARADRDQERDDHPPSDSASGLEEDGAAEGADVLHAAKRDCGAIIEVKTWHDGSATVWTFDTVFNGHD